MSDLKNKINGVFGYYNEDESLFPNIYELINLIIDCSWEAEKKPPEEREDLEAFKNLLSLETERIAKDPSYDSTLKQLIEMYLPRAYVGPAIDREEGQAIASLAGVYSHFRRNEEEIKEKGYDNMDEFIPLAAGIERFMSSREEKDVPKYVKTAYNYVKGMLNPSKKIIGLCNKYRNKSDFDPNIYELVALVGTAHMIEGDVSRNFCIGLLIALTGFETDYLVDRKIVDSEKDYLCVFLNKLWFLMAVPFSEEMDQQQKYTAEQVKAMADISSVYFFIKQQEKDLGQYQYDDFNKFKMLTSEYTEIIQTMPNTDLTQPLGFMLDYIKSKLLVQASEKKDKPTFKAKLNEHNQQG